LPLEPRLTRRVHRAAALLGGVRRLFFALDLAALEEPPERADSDGDPALLSPSCSSKSVMSLSAATAERIGSACASIRCETAFAIDAISLGASDFLFGLVFAPRSFSPNRPAIIVSAKNGAHARAVAVWTIRR
jgi:hypothetical protein